MKPLVIIGITAGILAGLWTQFSTPLGLITWVGFLSWASSPPAANAPDSSRPSRQPLRSPLGRPHPLGIGEPPHPRSARDLRRHRSLRHVCPGTLERPGLRPRSVRGVRRLLRHHLRRARHLPCPDRRRLPWLALRIHRRAPDHHRQEGSDSRTCRGHPTRRLKQQKRPFHRPTPPRCHRPLPGCRWHRSPTLPATT